MGKKIGQMKKVLIVEDSQAIRAILADLLRRHSFKVMEACDGLEARQLMLNHRPDLLITDIIMPRMNGYELCRWVKQEWAQADLPIILCSTKDQSFDQTWGLKQGGDLYICKPFNTLEMLDAVMSLLAYPAHIVTSHLQMEDALV